MHGVTEAVSLAVSKHGAVPQVNEGAHVAAPMNAHINKHTHTARQPDHSEGNTAREASAVSIGRGCMYSRILRTDGRWWAAGVRCAGRRVSEPARWNRQ